MALRLHLVPIPSTFSKNKPSTQNPFSVSSSLFFSNSSISKFSAITTSRKQCRNPLVFQISCTTQEQSSSSTTTTTTIEETPNTTTTTSSVKETRTRVIAQNVPWTYTIEDIQNLFEKYGSVIDIELSMYDKTRNRGLAFVKMGSAEEAAAAMTNLQSCELEGRVISIEYANIQDRKKSSTSIVKIVPKFNVFVANLAWSVTSAELKEFFSSMKVVSAEVIYQENELRKPTGYGFVAFDTKEEAEKAISTFQGKMLMGRPVRLASSRRKLSEQRKTDAKKRKQVEETSTEVKGGELSESEVKGGELSESVV